MSRLKSRVSWQNLTENPSGHLESQFESNELIFGALRETVYGSSMFPCTNPEMILRPALFYCKDIEVFKHENLTKHCRMCPTSYIFSSQLALAEEKTMVARYYSHLWDCISKLVPLSSRFENSHLLFMCH